MIIRILGEGQLSVDDAEATVLNELDTKLASAVDAGRRGLIPPCAE